MGRALTDGCTRPGRYAAQLTIFAAQIALFTGPAHAFSARLGWGPIANAKGYRVYTRQAGQSYDSGQDVGLIQPDAGAVHYVATGLPTGVTNYFAVAAYDAAGLVGIRSNELSLLVTSSPAPTSTSTATPTLRPSSTPTRPPAPIPTATPTRTFTPIAATRTFTSAPPTTTRTATRTTTGTPTYTATATPKPKRTRRLWFKHLSRVDRTMTVTVPVKVSSGSAVQSIALSATYDPNVVLARAVQLSDAAGTGTVDADLSMPGTLLTSADLSQPLTARREVFRIAFAAVGDCNTATEVRMTSCSVDGGAVGCSMGDGRITVHCR